MPVLAIAAPSFDEPSETFIRAHARSLAPGETVVLCGNRSGVEQLDLPGLPDLAFWWHPRSHKGQALTAPHRAWRSWVDPGLPAADRRRVLAFFAAHRPRAVLAEYGMTGCLLMRACDEAAVPLYVHFHGYDASLQLRDRRRVRQYRALFRSAAGIIAPSRFLADRLAAIGCPEDRLHVSPCGVDPQAFVPTRRLPGRVLAVGRLVDKKAPHLTIAAFGRIASRHPEARLDMVGDGPLAERCGAVIADLGLEDSVRMHGVQAPDFVAGLMGEASLFVQHSVTTADGDCEGRGVSILEAMASALPVASTRHNGIAESVDHGVTGLLVDEYDVDAMTEVMAGLLDDPERAAAMGVAGRQRVLAHYTQDKTRDRLRAIMGLPALPPVRAETSPSR